MPMEQVHQPPLDPLEEEAALKDPQPPQQKEVNPLDEEKTETPNIKEDVKGENPESFGSISEVHDTLEEVDRLIQQGKWNEAYELLDNVLRRRLPKF